MLDERQSAISPLAYLAELLKYTTEYIKDGDNAITVDALETQFHQPFWRYLTQVGDDFVYVDEVDRSVCSIQFQKSFKGQNCLHQKEHILTFFERLPSLQQASTLSARQAILIRKPHKVRSSQLRRPLQCLFIIQHFSLGGH